MKVSDFKEITKEYVETCEQIIKDDGACFHDCLNCPFYSFNSTNTQACTDVGHSTRGFDTRENDPLLVESCREFLELATDYFYHKKKKKKRGKFSFKKMIKKIVTPEKDVKFINMGVYTKCLDENGTCKYFEKGSFSCKHRSSFEDCFNIDAQLEAMQYFIENLKEINENE